MTKKLRTATFKFLDILMILTMVLASPMNVVAAPTAQESTPILTTEKSDYANGESAGISGSGFVPGEYVLSASGPDGTADWGTVTADDAGNFATASPELTSAGSYEVSAFAAGSDMPVASVAFTVTAPPAPTDPPTEPPTEPPTATEPPTETPSSAPTDEPTATSTDEPTSEPTATSTTEPTATATNTPTSAVPPTIASDLADYPQGGLVTLNGANWQGDTQVRIIVNDDIGQTWRRDVTVPVAADGTITDSFNLPSFFVATFYVTARGIQTDRVASTSFTDAPKITAKTHQGQESPAGTYTSGNITTYQEGDLINFRFTLAANEPSSGQLQVRFTGDDKTCLFFNGSFTLGTHDSSAPAIQPISGATPTVTPAGAPVATDFGTSNGEWVQTLNISFSGAGEAIVNYYLQLSDEAGECDGSSQHSRLSPAGGDVGQTGQQNVPVPANQIIELPEITVIKNIDRDGNGSFEDTADAGEYCFTLDGGSCVQTNASGQVIFTNVTPDGAHTITETQLDFSQGTYSFVSGSGTNCTFSGSTATATVASGTTSTDATCIFNNGLTTGTLTIVKVVINNNGGTKQISDFPLFYNGTPAASGVPNTVSPGTYTVTETQQAGYTATFSGDCNSSGVVTVGSGQNKTCTITNDDQPATLIVIKHVINDNGGTATAANFTLDSGGTNDSPDDFAGTEAPGTSITLDAGSYNVTETGPSGYTASFSTDCSGSIANGQIKTCTVTNDDNAATLIVIKHVINDEGGTATAGNFTMNVTATNPSDDSFPGEEAPGTTITLDAGSYSVSETGPSGYTASYSADCSGTIAAGQTKTCTVTNDDQPGTLIVKKVVINDNGGTATADDFSFEINGGTATSFEADGQNDLTVDAGTYDVTEPAIAGYSTTYDNCTDVVVPNGGSATCTITNDDASAHLTLVKQLVNDNGGAATANQWTLSAAGPTPLSGAGGADGDVNAGTYILSETGPSGYTASTWSCVGGSQNGNQITLANGQSATCTITNDDQTAHLKLIKVVVNDNGGAAVATDFTLSANGPTSISGAGGAESDVDAGTYTLSETSVPGYSASVWSCVGGTQNGSDITLANGQSATCTITNDDDTPSLTLVKVVVNDNGGTATAHQWTLTASGPTSFSGAGPSVSSDANFDAGTYTLSESGPAGYTASAWSCVGGTQNGSDITLANGESATCTITNNDNAPSLTLVKVMINDNGGTALTTDFTLSANGPTPISGAGGATSDATFDAGTYDLSETGPAGYTASDWVCMGGTQNDVDTITLGLGESATCTITNDDQAPSLTLIKMVINNDGGDALTSDWTLTASGPTGFSGPGPSVSNGASFDAGTYDLSESGPAGYLAGDWVCAGGTQEDADTITLALGQSATCTITNNDVAPTLKLVKIVSNNDGGNAVANDWTLFAEAAAPNDGRNFSNLGGSGVFQTVFANTGYDLSESTVAGYTAGSWDCDGGTLVDSTITLAEGETGVTCTITNDDSAPTLTLIKMVVNDDGGDAVVSDFPLFINGNPVTSGTSNILSANTLYTASETNLAGYTASTWSGDCNPDGTISLNEGEAAVCTITNDDVAPTLTLVKNVINDDGGNAAPNDFNLTIGGNSATSGTAYTLEANTAYEINETLLAGYSFVEITGNPECPAVLGGRVTLDEGEDVTCTITNDDVAPTLTLIKFVVNDDGGNAVIGDFPLFINGNPVTSGTANTLSANTLYTASETTLAGYTPSTWGGDCAADGTITLNEGDNKTCTITNDDVAPTLKLVKEVTNDNGGNAVADDWTLSAEAASPFEGRNFSNLGGSGTFETVFANQGYDLSETTVPGYTAGTWECDGGTLVDSTVTLEEGETDVTCTITNDDIAPQLRLIKFVVNDDGGNANIADFPLFIDGNAVTSGVFVPVTANTVHTATETNLTGYTASTWGGDCAADGTITLNEGEMKTCTITNDDVAPTLKLVKEVTNDDGGNAVADDWTLFAEAASPFAGRNFSNLGGSGVFETVFANQGYDLSESTVPGYNAGAWECDGGTLVGSTVTFSEGETGVTCTITNDDVAPTLTFIKIVINDNGGNAEPDDFNLTIGGSAATSGMTYTLDANTAYAINETQLSGYTFVDITGSAECPSVLGGTVTLDEGENITCTITNDDVAPTLTLIKNVINDSGGNAQPNDFNLTIDGSAATSGTAYPLDANTPYAIDETVFPGYSFVSITGDPECPADLGGTVTLDEGENVTCTITNDDQPATLIVIKHVVNDNGGTADAADFTLDSGGTDDTPDDFAGEEAPGTTITLDAGAYNVTETGPSGYSASFSADCSGTLANGETKTCTVTNDDIQPQLIVIKHVINDNGGTADAGDFLMEVSGNNVSPVNFPGNELGTNVALDAGNYSVAETGVAGYAPSFSADCTGSIALGETKTCTITNNDISPTLTVIKVLLPGDDTGLFNLQIDGVTQAADVGDNGTTGPVDVNAGVVHTVGETAGTGTSLSDYVTTISGGCAADGTVSLALAEDKTCTITNVRRGSIVIVKNTLGGDGTFDFTSGTLGNFNLTTSSGSASTTFSGLDPANTYNVAENVPAGWELNFATCDSGETIDSINLDPGETVTCTFENEKFGSIVVVKNTVGGDGTFDFTSNTLDNFSLTTASNTASATFSNLDVDLTYDVAETVPTGWDLTRAACDSGETIDNIDLDPGETVTCTITNTKRGHIIIDKVTLPSGDAQSFAFTTTGSGYTGFNLTDAATPNDQELAPGVYSVTETVPAGWDLTVLSCSDPGDAPVIAGNKATIDLAAGETVTCTFTNTKRGTITIVKDALPDDAQDFAFTSTIPGAASFSLDDDSNATLSNSKTITNVLPGAYSVTEGAVAGWDLTSLTCNDANGITDLGTRTANIALDPGEEVTCTFTNTKRGTIIVEKQTNPNAAPGSFIFTGTAAGTISDDGQIVVSNLVPGTYTSTEADPSPMLFALTSIVCNDGRSATPSTGNLATRTAAFNLDPGETVKCTFTNTKDFHPGTIGFWKNWRNHYTSTQFQGLINYLKADNPKVYNKDLVNNTADDLTIGKVDTIMNVGNKTPREQMILAQFTALKFNLAITQLDGTGGLVQKNDDLCTAGVVDVSGISGAASFFGTSTPTIQQIIAKVEGRWTGKLTTNRSDWKWNLTTSQKSMLINLISGINEGTLVMSSGCP